MVTNLKFKTVSLEVYVVRIHKSNLEIQDESYLMLYAGVPCKFLLPSWFHFTSYLDAYCLPTLHEI